MSISHRKYLEFVEVHRECKQFPQVPQHTAAKSRTQGLGEKEDNPVSLSVLLTHPTPTSSKAQESNSEELPLVAPRGGSAFQPCAWASSAMHVGGGWGLENGLPTRLSLVITLFVRSQYFTVCLAHILYLIWFKPLGPFRGK